MYQTLITASDLAKNIDNPSWVIVDCRFSLKNTDEGRQEYMNAHIPGAVYAHLDEDLSGPIIPGKTSRHPLPDVEKFTHILSSWGIEPGIQVVAYDNKGGAIAARLWWMLKWVGHNSVAVLNGGWKDWLSKGYPVASGLESKKPREFTPQVQEQIVCDAEYVLGIIDDPSIRLFDSRSPERYRGEKEPIDPIAGHISNAISAPFADNLDTNGLFKTKDVLNKRFQELLGHTPAEKAIFYCGSGVTAAHNILSLAHAGLGNTRLYAGSWSEWITDSTRPIAVDE